MLEVDTVLIEKQPKVNPKMRSVAACLQTYFMIRCCVDLGEETEVTLYSPKYKLNCYTGPPLEVSGTNQYYRNKMMGIAHCRVLLEEKNESKHRIICDYISGMTDRFATNLYKSIYE